ncbi:hypothetical protein [Actinoplanes sp. NPDC049802]|uniref:hypothetical protein n=1 Tax=Actinoplanes sp. NPDC049802 TaxID=3154742 RepID=UPI0033EB7CE2
MVKLTQCGGIEAARILVMTALTRLPEHCGMLDFATAINRQLPDRAREIATRSA